MEIAHLKTLGKDRFQEVTLPRKVFELGNGIIAVYHSYTGQWAGRELEIRKKALTLFSDNGQTTLAHLNHFRYTLNDMAYDGDAKQVLIATGDYDGGCYFEGELLLWDLDTNTTQSIINNKREFVACSFVGDQIRFDVNPTDDLFTDDLTIKSYQMKRGNWGIDLADLSPLKTVAFSWSDYQNAWKVDTAVLSTLLGEVSAITGLIWDMQIIDQQVIAACSDGLITIYDLENDTYERVQISEKGDCVQLFVMDDNKLAINVVFRDFDHNETSFYLFDLKAKTFIEKQQGLFSLSKSRGDFFLARQLDHNANENQDLVLDEDLNILHQLTIGHYDLFNHYLRIDEDNHLYALVGNPKDQHQNKEIWRIDPANGVQTKLIAIEQNRHLNEPNFLKIGELILVQGKEYRPRYGAHVMIAYNEKGMLLWEMITEANAIDLKPLGEYCFLAVYNNGSVKVHRVSDGKVVLDMLPYLQLKNTQAICAATQGKILAIGYDNGMVEVLELVTEN